MPLGATEVRGEEGLHEVPRDLGSDRPAPHAQDVHVVVLDALACREVIVHQRGADAAHLVRAYRRADATAADTDAARDLPGYDRARERDHEVRAHLDSSPSLAGGAARSACGCHFPAAFSW